MKLLRWIGVILVFSLEVRVRAFQQEPPKCLKSKSKVCSVLATKTSVFYINKNNFQLSPGSLIYRETDEQWNLVKGTLRVKVSSPLSIKTKVGALFLKPGIHWVQWRDEKVWAYAIKGEMDVRVQSKPSVENLVTEGFFNWYALIDQAGQNPQGVPRRITGLTAKTFLPGVTKLSDFKAIKVGEARVIGVASEFYKEVAQSMEDGVVAREQKISNEKLSRKRFDQNLRQMFRSKYLGPVDLDQDSSNSDN